MEGWIKLHRKLLNWEWYKNSNMVHVFIHLLFSANYESKKWQGIEIKRGQFVTGRKSLSGSTGISEQSIRTCLSKLKSTNEITIKSTNKYSVITINKYEEYQMNGEEATNTLTTKTTKSQPTVNQQLTTTNNIKKDKKEKNIKKREELFHNSLTLHIPEFGNELITNFFNYWKERNRSGTKMLFELKETWSLKGRLAMWRKKEKEFGKKPEKSETVEQQIERLGL